MRLNVSKSILSVVAASSTLSLAVGAVLGYILAKNRVTAQYEGMIEEEVVKAKEFYSKASIVDVDLSSVPKEVVEDAVEAAKESFRPRSNTVKVDYDDGYAEKFTQYNQIRKPYSGFEDGEGADNSMEAVEQRLIDAAKKDVEEAKKRSGEFPKEEEDEMYYDEQDNSVDRSQRSSDHPFILSVDEFEGNDLDYNQNTLTYFEGDDTLVDEREQPITPHNGIVGEGNLKFGQGSNDANIVYIRNDRMEVDFEVVRSPGTYTEEVLGIIPSESARTRRGMN